MTFSVLIAPDKFKGTLSAKEVADAIGRGLVHKVAIEIIPLADGGDGSIESVAAAGFEVLELDSAIPSATSRPARIARKDDVYFIESAEFCGLQHVMGDLDPMGSSTLGVGLAVRSALEMGARTIVLGVGGTASTDGGVGFLMGLGGKFYTESGETISLGGGGLSHLSVADLSEIDPRLMRTKIILASDVDSHLLGLSGAAQLFSPQKGATLDQVKALEIGMARLVATLETGPGFWARQTELATVTPGSGAGGGLGFAALLIGAIRVSGADYIFDLLGIDQALTRCDFVVTGEGALDEQSLSGKLPIALARRARARNIPTIAVVGTCKLLPEDYISSGISEVFSLDELDPRCATDRGLSKRLLTQIGEEIAKHLSAYS